MNEYLEKYDTILKSRPGEELSITFETENFAIATFSKQGGYLHIHRKSISLFIPPGAIREDQERIYMYLDDGKYSDRVKSTTRLAPVVTCGPKGLHFLKSVILSFPSHAIRIESWNFKAFSTQGSGATSSEWEERDIVGLNVKDGTIHITMDHFTRSTLGATSSNGEEKALKLAVFTKPFFDGEQFNFYAIMYEVDEPGKDQERKDIEKVSKHILTATALLYISIVEMKLFVLNSFCGFF